MLGACTVHRYNLKLQYCMALPREVLMALEVHAVSHVGTCTCTCSYSCV